MEKLYHITRGKNQDGLYDAPMNYRRWPHPANVIELKNKRDDMYYKLDIYTDGSKNEKGVGSGVPIFVDGSLTHQLRYKLAEKCSNNQAEQLAIVKALTKLRSMHTIQWSQRTTAVHTDSRITVEAIANPRNHQSLVESIRKEIRTSEEDGWIVHFTWAKAHDNNPGNELADQLANEAACDNSLPTTYHNYPKSAVTSELKCLGLQKWQSEWYNTCKGAWTKTFPTIQVRLTKRLQINLHVKVPEQNLPDDKSQTNQTTTNKPKPINDSNWAWEIKILSVQI